MRLTVCFVTALALISTSAAASSAFQLNETTWTIVDGKTKVSESIDASGNYIENAVSGKHIDHGTAVLKDGKACFTSSMTKEGELCWTAPRYALKIGQSFVAKSDKGRKLRVTRIKYTVLKMPS